MIITRDSAAVARRRRLHSYSTLFFFFKKKNEMGLPSTGGGNIGLHSAIGFKRGVRASTLLHSVTESYQRLDIYPVLTKRYPLMIF